MSTDLPSRLRNARTDAGLTQAQAAARVGLTQGRIAQIEGGDPRNAPTLETLAALASAYGLPGAEFDARLAGAAAKPKPKRSKA